MIWRSVAALVFLVPCSIWDVRTRTIPIPWMAAGGVLAIGAAATQAIAGETDVVNLLFAMSPGIFLIALSIVTEQQIGAGDGIGAAILGLFLGAPGVYIALMGALFLSSIFAAGLLLTHRGSRYSRMPWIPFMTAGVVLFLVLEWTG